MVAKAWRLATLPVTSWQVHAAPLRSKWWTDDQDFATMAASSGFCARLNGMIWEACFEASSTSGAGSTLLHIHGKHNKGQTWAWCELSICLLDGTLMALKY